MRVPTSSGERATRQGFLEGEPLDRVLEALDPQNRDYLEAFAASVPQELPALAYVSSVIVDPLSPAPEGDSPVILEAVGNYVHTFLGVANPGTNVNEPVVVCVRNGLQTACTEQADVWRLSLSPRTMALVPIDIQAEPGDHIAFLVLAQQEPVRYEPSSQMVWAYVDHPRGRPLVWTDAPAQEPLLGGCDFIILVKDPNDRSPMNFNLHDGVRRGSTLYLLIQLCNPTGTEFVKLVSLVDRMAAVRLTGDLWEEPIRLTGAATLVEVATSGLPGTEFQIAAVPLSEAAAAALRRHSFTQAVIWKSR